MSLKDWLSCFLKKLYFSNKAVVSNHAPKSKLFFTHTLNKDLKEKLTQFFVIWTLSENL